MKGSGVALNDKLVLDSTGCENDPTLEVIATAINTVIRLGWCNVGDYSVLGEITGGNKLVAQNIIAENGHVTKKYSLFVEKYRRNSKYMVDMKIDALVGVYMACNNRAMHSLAEYDRLKTQLRAQIDEFGAGFNNERKILKENSDEAAWLLLQPAFQPVVDGTKLLVDQQYFGSVIILTSKDKDLVNVLVTAHGLKAYVTEIIEAPKGKDGGIAQIAAKTPGRVCLVDDTPVKYEAALPRNVIGIQATWGACCPEAQKQAEDRGWISARLDNYVPTVIRVINKKGI